VAEEVMVVAEMVTIAATVVMTMAVEDQAAYFFQSQIVNQK
jgi:hypothetical protein